MTPSGNVTLYAQWEQSIDISSIPVGAYIKYDLSSKPTVTVLGTDSGLGSGNANNQYFYPSQYEDGWKVMYNNNGQLDIVSAESVGNLELYGATGYARAVYTLNTLCSGYMNNLAISARSLGSTKEWIETVTKTSVDDTKSAGIIDTSNDQYPLIYEEIGNVDYPYEDLLWKQTIPINDSNYLISDLRHTNGDVWLASRSLINGSDYREYYVLILFPNGKVVGLDLYYTYSSGESLANGGPLGVRPVISLDSGLKVISGPECDGSTLEKAYVLSF